MNQTIKKAAVSAMAVLTGFSVLSAPALNGGTALLEIPAITASAASTSVTATSQNKVCRPSSTPILQNGEYKLKLQGDGHLIVYDGNGNNKWSTYTYFGGKYKDYTFEVQGDGNLVLYGKNSAGKKLALWASMTNSNTMTTSNGYYYTLELTRSGSLQLYRTYQGRSYTRCNIWNSNGLKLRRCNVNQLWMNDPNHAGWNELGQTLSGGSWSIKDAGCALASYTMVYNYFKGTSKQIWELNTAPYVVTGDTTFGGNDPRFTIGYVRGTTSRNITAQTIAENLKRGLVIVHCGNADVQNGHFVVVYECTKASNPTYSDLRVLDPAYTDVHTVQDLANKKGTNVNQMFTFLANFSANANY